jgi:hypothetical protein
MKGFDQLTAASGETLSVANLGDNEVYVSRETAAGLDVGVGDSIGITRGLALPITGGGMRGKARGELRHRAPGRRRNSGSSSCT